MKISRATIDILESFSKVNDSIKIMPGNVLWCRSENIAVAARAKIDETFPEQVTLFKNLGQFLKIVRMMDDPEFEFKGNHVDISSGKYRQKFFYSDPSAPISTTKKDPAETPLNWDFDIRVEAADLKKLNSAAAINGSPHVVLECDGGDKPIFVRGRDINNSATNVFSIETTSTSKDKFSLVIEMSNLKIVDGGYTVRVIFDESGAKPIKLTNWDRDGDNEIRYFIALDLNSRLG